MSLSHLVNVGVAVLAPATSIALSGVLPRSPAPAADLADRQAAEMHIESLGGSPGYGSGEGAIDTARSSSGLQMLKRHLRRKPLCAAAEISVNVTGRRGPQGQARDHAGLAGLAGQGDAIA